MSAWHKKHSEFVNSQSFIRTLAFRIVGEETPELVNYKKNNPKPALSEKLIKKIEVKTSLKFVELESQNANRKDILERDNHTCQLCFGMVSQDLPGNGLEVHHIIPRSKGGSNNIQNLITLCVSCHDGETRFGHVRIHKTFPSRSPLAFWPWEIKPSVLALGLNQLTEFDNYFSHEYL